ncbi:toxin-antitoxin system YwqK family antitoxin [Mangrovibacterium sp.]|uniref:toxin-antitoxin system YwqK family antitoxin n=1 Tax=Mangrovibacterium sp. TaxID=1961364 RepID=UPI003567C78D
MLKRITLLSVFLMCLIGQSAKAQEVMNQVDAAGNKQGLWEKKQPNGKLLYRGYFEKNKPVGEWKRYHSNGVVKAQINYRADSDTAVAILFDETGVKVAEGFYLGQEKAGRWIYYKKRQKSAEETWANGLKNGIAKTYYPTGELFVESNYVNGKLEGVYKTFLTNGKVYFECQMKDDKRDGFCQIFYPNGEMETEAFYENGIRHNEWKYYDESGNYSYSLIYDRGLVLNQSVLDSLEQIRYKQLDDNRNKVIDPETFMSDPVEYMIQKGIH